MAVERLAREGARGRGEEYCSMGLGAVAPLCTSAGATDSVLLPYCCFSSVPIFLLILLFFLVNVISEFLSPYVEARVLET
jgi:hypothetical protein